MKSLIYTLAALLLLGSCSSKDRRGTMEEMSQNEDFRQKHERPERIDFEGKGSFVSIPLIGEEATQVYRLMAEEQSDNYLLVFHEWWGLNDHILREAERLYDSLNNVNVLVLDLYDGQVAENAERASELVSSRDPERLKNIVKMVGKYAGPEAKIATLGWCYGGAWSLRAAHLLNSQTKGCVVYYGKVPLEELRELPDIQSNVLGLFAEQDGHITIEYASQLEEYITEQGQSMDLHTFDADHAFANPSSPRYEEEAAKQANALALAYLFQIYNGE